MSRFVKEQRASKNLTKSFALSLCVDDFTGVLGNDAFQALSSSLWETSIKNSKRSL
jgi:hypothetical protein